MYLVFLLNVMSKYDFRCKITTNIAHMQIFLRFFVFLSFLADLGSGICTTNKTQEIMINDFYESTAERRARRNKDIKLFFHYLIIDRHMACMDAYEVVGYHFYLSENEIRHIIAGRR